MRPNEWVHIVKTSTNEDVDTGSDLNQRQFYSKLDGVGPVDNRPSTILSNKQKM